MYKIKYHVDGSIECYKTRSLACGFTQIDGLDFHGVYVRVANLVNVKCLLAIAVFKGRELYQLDINNTILHGNLSEEVYVSITKS